VIYTGIDSLQTSNLVWAPHRAYLAYIDTTDDGGIIIIDVDRCESTRWNDSVDRLMFTDLFTWFVVVE
jgi:hypothetical protein